jgi:hypothetical protein
MSSLELLPLGAALRYVLRTTQGAPFDTPTPHYGGQAQGPLQSESSIKSSMVNV